MYFSHSAGQVNNLFFCYNSVESQVRPDYYYFYFLTLGSQNTYLQKLPPFFQNQMVVLSFRQYIYIYKDYMVRATVVA